jgi:hypothetical protein
MTENQKLVGEIMHHVNNALGSPFCRITLLMHEIKDDELSKEEILSELKGLRDQLSSIGDYISKVFWENN